MDIASFIQLLGDSMCMMMNILFWRMIVPTCFWGKY
jgi:hypothetical protein